MLLYLREYFAIYKYMTTIILIMIVTVIEKVRVERENKCQLVLFHKNNENI